MHCFKDTDVQMIGIFEKTTKFLNISVAFIPCFNSNEMFNFEDISKLYMRDKGILESIREIITLFTIKKVLYIN